MITYAITHEGLRIYRAGGLVAEIGVDQFLTMISQMARVLCWHAGKGE